jgi:cytochrome c biogenesis protein CcmG/thiol:disulfide interchange protein DsbE
VRRTRIVLALLAAAAVAGIVAAGVVLAGGRDEPSRPAPATASPSVAGKLVEASGVDPITGAAVDLADYRGTPVVLNFWASWCPPCREEIPALVELAGKHPEVALVGVNFQDSESGAKGLQRQLAFDFPSIADPNGDLGFEIGIQGMPTTLFLDAEHRIAGAIVGGTDLAGLEHGVELIAP